MSRDTIRLPHDAYRLLQTLRAAGHSAYCLLYTSDAADD